MIPLLGEAPATGSADTEGMEENVTPEQAIADYRAARDAYLAKTRDADESFVRYFNKLQRGERTNGAATRRLENQANELSIVRYSAESVLYKMDIDPDAIDHEDGITDTSYRMTGGGYS